MITLIGALILSLGYGWLSRMSGGAPIKLPFGLDQWLYAVPYTLLGYLCGGPIWGFITLATAFLGKRTGHGQWMDLGTSIKIITPERFDFVVNWIWGDDTNETTVGKGEYWRDFTGLCVSGLFVGLGAILALIFSGHFVLALLVGVGASAKGPAYALGWAINGEPTKCFGEHLDEATELGEFLTGFFGGLPVFYGILMLLLGGL